MAEYYYTYLLFLPLLAGLSHGGSRSSIWLHTFLSLEALADSSSGIFRCSSVMAEIYFHELSRGPVWNTSVGRVPKGILLRCPNTSTDSFPQRSSDSTPRPSRMTELLTLSLRESPATIRRNLILAACILDLVLSVMNHPS